MTLCYKAVKLCLVLNIVDMIFSLHMFNKVEQSIQHDLSINSSCILLHDGANLFQRIVLVHICQ